MENYEEKFKQRLEKAKKYMSYHNDGIKECLIDIFPELAESEDEKIRKEIIGHFEKHLECSEEYGKDVLRSWIAWLEKQKELNDKEDGDFTIYHPVKNWNGEYECIPYSFYGTLSSFSEDKDIMDFLRSSFYSAQECIEWIEKQGEQKPADKVEPKFKVGDWVVYKNDICQIVKREEGCNKLVTVFGIEKELVNERNLSTARLWTIQDAKDGDVLAIEWNQDNDIWEKILIFKALNDNGVEGYGNTFKNKDLFFIDEKVPYYSKTWSKYLRPATKEQRDLLFQKMKEAGYEWYAEKKELKKIEQKPVEWSDDDEKIMLTIISDGVRKVGLDEGQIQWLKALKNRCLPQPKQEWNEEDEMMSQNIIDCLRNGYKKLPTEILKYESWLKSLKPPYYCDDCKLKKSLNWKPSEEQMETLGKYVRNTVSDDHEHLEAIYKQLQKL